MIQENRRMVSIDAFRALTMFLMIFVNDLETLTNVPNWLMHAAKEEDRMGLADAVFPAFLFIVGLSIPLAIQNRRLKGDSTLSIFIHVFTRAFALLVMGIFEVNLESYDITRALLPKSVWQIATTLCFFLIWMDYPTQWSKVKQWIMQGVGIVLLIVLAFLFKGGGLNEDGVPLSSSGMHPLWYGILGLIGWSYLICACFYLFSKGRLYILIPMFLALFGFSIADKEDWLDWLDNIRDSLWIVSSGALPAITMAGVICSVIYMRLRQAGKPKEAMRILGVIAIVLLVFGFGLRHFWNISKIRANPPWVLICTAISIGCFIFMIYWMDIKGRIASLKWIWPAGTSTLTCYLLPYIHYGILVMLGPPILLPMFLRTGIIGIVKSLLYAWLIVWIAGGLEKRRIKLSI